MACAKGYACRVGDGNDVARICSIDLQAFACLQLSYIWSSVEAALPLAIIGLAAGDSRLEGVLELLGACTSCDHLGVFVVGVAS